MTTKGPPQRARHDPVVGDHVPELKSGQLQGGGCVNCDHGLMHADDQQRLVLGGTPVQHRIDVLEQPGALEVELEHLAVDPPLGIERQHGDRREGLPHCLREQRPPDELTRSVDDDVGGIELHTDPCSRCLALAGVEVGGRADPGTGIDRRGEIDGDHVEVIGPPAPR